ncbi:MAG: hypothetical protein AABY32_05660 [Nanoarchaeota archaeon]
MKKTLAKLLIAGMVGITVGCSEMRKEYSDIKHEEGIVTEWKYTPEQGGGNGSPTIVNVGGNLGIGTGGIGMGAGGMTFSPGYSSDEYRVTIESKDKTYFEHGDKEVYKNLYNKLKKGQKVDVSYKEVYNAFYKDINKDGEKELVKKIKIDHKFVDANPKDSIK